MVLFRMAQTTSSVVDDDLSMAFRELYPIVAAAVVWGKCWTAKRIMFLCDNLSTVRIIQKGRSKSLGIMKIICVQLSL